MSRCFAHTGTAATQPAAFPSNLASAATDEHVAAVSAPRRAVSVEVESYESWRYWLCPVTFDNCCLSLRSLPPALTASPPAVRSSLLHRSEGVSQRRAIIPAHPSPLISQQDPALAPGFFSSTLHCCLPPMQAPAQSSPKERVYIDRKRGSHQKERRKRVSVRLNGASFLQQRRGDFIERPLQAIDRPSGMDTVKPRMKSEWGREGGGGVQRIMRCERNTEAERHRSDCYKEKGTTTANREQKERARIKKWSLSVFFVEQTSFSGLVNRFRNPPCNVLLDLQACAAGSQETNRGWRQTRDSRLSSQQQWHRQQHECESWRKRVGVL